MQQSDNLKINLIKFYRVNVWSKIVGIPLIGILLTEFNFQLISLVILSALLALAHSFSLNDFFDFKLAKERNYISKISERYGEKIIESLILLPFIFALIIGFYISSISFLILFCYFSLSFLYSCPPFRLKRHYLLSILTCSICMGGLLFLFGFFSLTTKLTFEAFVFFIIFFFYFMFVELVHQIDHMRIDKKSGIRSFPITFGVNKTLSLLKFTQLIPLLISIIALILNFRLHLIFTGSIFFCLLRIVKVETVCKKKLNIKQLRKPYGFYEGLYYLLFLMGEHFSQIFP